MCNTQEPTCRTNRHPRAELSSRPHAYINALGGGVAICQVSKKPLRLTHRASNGNRRSLDACGYILFALWGSCFTIYAEKKIKIKKKKALNTAEDLKWQWYTWHATDGARHRPPFSFTSSSCSCCASGRKWPELQRLIRLCCCDERTWHSCWIQCDSTYLRPFLGFYQSATRW